MGKVVAFLSGSGGCGRTTVAAAMGVALARMGKRALVMDMCFGARGLDMPLGLESRVVFDIADALSGECSVEQAIVADQPRACPDMIAAALDGAGTDTGKLPALLDVLRMKYDWIALDVKAGTGESALLAARVADLAAVAAAPDNASIRAAESVLAAVRRIAKDEPLVLINKLIPSFVSCGAHMTPDAAAQTLETRLLGVVPYDEEIARHAALGRLTELDIRSPGFQAISVAADRTLGAAIPKHWIVGRRGLRLAETIREEWE